MDAKTPRFKKLGTGGDVYGWITQLQTHFEAMGTWAHVSSGAAIVVGKDETETAEMKEAKCRRDILLSLHDDISLSVRHLSNAHEMFKRVKKMFVGSLASQKRELRNKLQALKFEGNYFFFIFCF